MQMSFNHLSFWERKWLTDDIDFAVIGAGIVGLSTAYHLKKKRPSAKVVIIDKGILPLTASSKNAGFACFGSPSEILDDLLHSPAEEVWQTVEMRWKGLLALKEWLGDKELDLQELGSWDLIEDIHQAEEIRNKLNLLNSEIGKITGEKLVYSEDLDSLKKFGFEHVSTSFRNRLEGQLDASKLIQGALKKVAELDIPILRGTEIIDYTADENVVHINTNFGTLKTSNLILCTNGFTSEFNTDLDVKPARAQVLITKQIPGLKIKGTFHIDCGYYYFRNVGNRLLIGGGRNINFQNEETAIIETTEEIQNGILDKLNQIVLPNTPYEIDYSWAGIMGVGSKKQPIIKRIHPRVCVGIRMGGMGVAIGTLVGKNLAEMHS
jgi:glycine/D-amino acid oxidase-like deaminating enzyme